MKKQNWIWMPHPAHLCVSHMCRFHLSTYVGKYIVSTVGEYSPPRSVKEITARIKDLDWHEKNNHLKGEEYEYAYLRKFGFDEIGMSRTYETMVFKAVKSLHSCCPYIPESGSEVDFKGYKNSQDAYAGHLKLCKKWSKI